MEINEDAAAAASAVAVATNETQNTKPNYNRNE